MATITSLTAHQLLDIAKDETKKLESGEIFIVRDLFKGYEWNRIERKKRLHECSGGNIKPISKTSSGQQKYQKL